MRLTIEELLWDAQGRVATAGASTYKLPSWSELPPEFHVDFLERAAEPGVDIRKQSGGRAATDARHVGARGDSRCGSRLRNRGGPVALALPATPERIFFAIRHARRESQTPANGVVAGKTRGLPRP